MYRILEPDALHADHSSDRKNPLTSGTAEAVRFTYPDYNQDAETLMVHPASGDIYIVTKRVSGPAGVYRLRPDFESNTVDKLEKVAEISVPAIPNGLLTGGDISPDGKRVVLCDYTQGYEFRLPEGAANFDDIWQQSPEPVESRKTGAWRKHNLQHRRLVDLCDERREEFPRDRGKARQIKRHRASTPDATIFCQ